MFWIGMFLVLSAGGALMVRDIRVIIMPFGQFIAIMVIACGLTFMSQAVVHKYDCQTGATTADCGPWKQLPKYIEAEPT
jgi:hypothetical protein